MLATRLLAVLDRYRVPVALEEHRLEEGLGRLTGEGGELRWTVGVGGDLRELRLDGVTLFARPLGDEAAAQLLGRGWEPAEPLSLPDGTRVASVWRSTSGVFLPFDPDEAISALLREDYVSAGDRRVGWSRATALRRLYYAVRPLLPRSTQMALRRRYARVQERASFPGWPQETALHELEALVLALAERAAGAPLPWLAPWPDDRGWAVVLTHDVERARGYAHIGPVLDVERKAGVRSAWYFVPERDYAVDDACLRDLRDGGFEIALHGLRHDGRDLAERTFDMRLPAMRAYAERWGAVGFRSPATQRDWERISRLGLDHDSSWSDVARYEPQCGGSCSILPFFVGQVVELPITLPMDHTLFELLGHQDGSAWTEKAAFLRARGGLALLLTHPDYLLHDRLLGAYERFVGDLAGDASAWHALPREASAWWRARAASALVPDGEGWRVEGPAAERATIRLGAPEPAYAPAGPVA